MFNTIRNLSRNKSVINISLVFMEQIGLDFRNDRCILHGPHTFLLKQDDFLPNQKNINYIEPQHNFVQMDLSHSIAFGISNEI